MTAPLTPPPATSSPLELSGTQRLLYQSIEKRDIELAQMYIGALYALSQEQNPDRWALAAHGIRELMEKMPRIVDVIPQQTNVLPQIDPLAAKWNRHAVESDCHDGESFAGVIDSKLKLFLDQAKSFFDWFNNRPNRKDERRATIRGLDPAPLPLPREIEDLRVKEWDVYVGFFNGVSHHTKIVSDEDFGSALFRVEEFLLNYFSPRTCDDLSEIDALLSSGEKRAERS